MTAEGHKSICLPSPTSSSIKHYVLFYVSLWVWPESLTVRQWVDTRKSSFLVMCHVYYLLTWTLWFDRQFSTKTLNEFDAEFRIGKIDGNLCKAIRCGYNGNLKLLSDFCAPWMMEFDGLTGDYLLSYLLKVLVCSLNGFYYVAHFTSVLYRKLFVFIWCY